jgi:peptide/nickel transport system substrate-binding protein
MKRHRTTACFPVCIPFVLLACGCATRDDHSPEEDVAPPPAAKAPADKPFQLADLVEPFEPPPLSELDKSADWMDRPVYDPMERLREHQAAQGPPPLTDAEALALRNDSPEANEKIKATLGRAAPEDGAGIDYGATLVRHANGDIKTTNPVLRHTVTDYEYHELASVNLFTHDWNLEKFANKQFVESWQRSRDGLADKVVMRDDMTWSDGWPVTAHDVEFTFQVIMTSSVPVPALRTDVQQLRWVKAYDDRTVVYFHKEPLATNVLSMTFPLLPKHVYQKSLPDDPTITRSPYHTGLELAPVVGGAYVLVKRVPGQEFVLKRRAEFFMHDGRQVRPKPYFAEIRFKVIEDLNTALLALKSGDLHELLLLPDQWISQTNDDDFYRLNTKASAVGWTDYYIVWNERTPYFSDPRVRWALSYAMDYEEMLKTIFYGIFDPSRGLFHPTSPTFPDDGPQPLKQDLDKAEDLLDEAGWTDTDGDGVRDKLINGHRIPFRFTLMCHQVAMLVRLNTLVKESLDKIGIDCIVKPTEFTVAVQATRDKKYQAYQGVWQTGSDPSEKANLFMTGEGRNYGSYSNPRVDQLFVEARRELDDAARNRIYGEIHKLLWEDQPYTWLIYRNDFYGFNKRLRGYNFSPRGPYGFAPGVFSIYMPAHAP